MFGYIRMPRSRAPGLERIPAGITAYLRSPASGRDFSPNRPRPGSTNSALSEVDRVTAAQGVLHELYRIGTRNPAQKRKSICHVLLGSGRHLSVDFKGLKYELNQVGFVRVRKASFGDSDDPILRGIESESRYEAAVAVECRRPQ
jgi:hypothetical protein